MKKHSSLLIIAAALFWGVTGLFTRTLDLYGMSTRQVVAFRLVWAAVILIIIVFIKDKNLFKIKLRDLPLLMLIGVGSIFSMSMFYISAISDASMSVAAILLYTAPFFVTAVSAVLYKEKLTIKGLSALVIAFLGCILVSGTGGSTTPSGLFYGLMAGITYASYSIIGKYALQKYSPYTVTVWSFIFAAISALVVINPVKTAVALVNAGGTAVFLSVLLGLVTAVIPFLLYTQGLAYTPAGKASVMATAEPMVATVAGLVVYREVPGLISVFGIILVIFAIALLNNFGRPIKE